jgi:hypothetical protein
VIWQAWTNASHHHSRNEEGSMVEFRNYSPSGLMWELQAAQHIGSGIACEGTQWLPYTVLRSMDMIN